MARILVVDDEVQIRRMMKRLLEQDGHQVFLAATADEALELLENTSLIKVKATYISSGHTGEDIPDFVGMHDIDLIISDFRMKRSSLDGVSFLKLVHCRFREIKTILMSAMPPSEADELGCPILVKSRAINDLKEMIHSLIDG